MTTPEAAIEKAKALIVDWHKEHFIGIYLNTRKVPTKIELISLGILDRIIVHPRETFRPALVNHAESVILLHNHPSGEAEPSGHDLATARRLKQAGEILGITLVDFIIFTQDGQYYSFHERRLI